MFVTGNRIVIKKFDIEVLLWVKTTLGWLKILSNHNGNRTYDLWNAIPALGRRSYAVVRTVRYCDISEMG